MRDLRKSVNDYLLALLSHAMLASFACKQVISTLNALISVAACSLRFEVFCRCNPGPLTANVYHHSGTDSPTNIRMLFDRIRNMPILVPGYTVSDTFLAQLIWILLDLHREAAVTVANDCIGPAWRRIRARLPQT
jgi:hypothetical protein